MKVWGSSGDATDGSNNPVLTVESTGTHVYFYSEINSDRCLALIQELRAIDAVLRVERQSRNLPERFPMVPIWLHVNSPGGYLTDGFAVSDQLAQIASPVYSIIEGQCASAATLLSMACRKRYITPSSMVLIHQLSGMSWGTYEQIKDEMKAMDMLMSKLCNFYKFHSNLGEQTIKGILQRDSWFNAEMCVENGIVDEIIT